MPNRRAIFARIGFSKNIQIWAPFPERERSTRMGTSLFSQIFLKVLTSAIHSESMFAPSSPPFKSSWQSKSNTKKLIVSSGNIGYSPITSEASSFTPSKCSYNTCPVSSLYLWFRHSPQWNCGLSFLGQIPSFQKL